MSRSPKVIDIATYLGVTEEAVLEGLEGARAYRATSLSTPVGTATTTELADTLGADDHDYELVELPVALAPALATLEQGWNERVGAFTDAFGSDELDASVLLMPLVNFLPATDGRMRATIEAIERELATDGVVRRSANEPAGFVWCSFWLVGCLVLAGDNQRATELFERTCTKANDLGIFAEQIDLVMGEYLGNTPQALSHIGQIITAARLTDPTIRF
ncbi:glycoside hydrolase family 15 protein [Micromonospora sp. NBC_00389]|uniref:glycoside hydrolase family 15 protein n=1 Tax=Micromonospora sp. NBC_00389 TaxID=2903586 RepID=UPI002E1C7EEA